MASATNATLPALLDMGGIRQIRKRGRQGRPRRKYPECRNRGRRARVYRVVRAEATRMGWLVRAETAWPCVRRALRVSA